MRFKTFLLLLLFIFSTIDDINAKWSFGGRSRAGSSFGRGSNFHKPSYGGSSSHHGTSSFGSSSGTRASASNHVPVLHRQTSSVDHRSTGFGTSTRVNTASHSRESSTQRVTSQQSKDINTHFLNAEGGGAKRPAQTKPAETSFGTSHPSAVPAAIGQSHLSNTRERPGLATESKQTASAPTEHVIRPTGTYQNQGSNIPYTPNHSTVGQTNPPWSNPYLGTNRPSVPSQTPTPWSNPYLSANRPTMPGSQPPYPQNYPTSIGSQFGQPPMGGHTTYPHYIPSSGSWSAPFSTPNHQSSAMPMGNPYSLHPPGSMHSAPGQTYYPQQSQVFAQPAAQPFVPGQTVIMVPGQDSGRGFGQMVKEALVFSTINAGVNRLINPHTHYVESKPESSPATTTHITYNNHYFNTAPEVNGTLNPTGTQGTVPAGNYPTGTQGTVSAGNYPTGTQGTVPAGNYPTGTVTSNVGAGNTLSSLGNGNAYPTSISNSEVYSPVSGTVNKGGGTITGTGMTGNIVPSEDRSNVLNNQGNLTDKSYAVNDTFFYKISDNELFKITEDLFAKSLNISKYIRLNLQNRITSFNITDEATEPLFDIDPELLKYPTIYVTRALYDNYEHDFRKKLNRTIETREHENLLIDTFLNTNVMATTMQWLADRGFIDPDDFERKDVLRRIWFTMFSGSSCGFERVFASENYGTALIGVQDWIYFENQESAKHIDYMGYVDKLNFGGTASLLKLNFQMDGIIRSNATIFVGTMPELEMSLYTICFFARPNNVCPVSFGGIKFNIYTHSFTYFGNEIIDLGLPLF